MKKNLKNQIGKIMNKNKHIQEKLRKVVELMTKKQLKEYETTTSDKFQLDSKSNTVLMKETLDDFYLMADTLIAQYYGVDMLKFREMFNLLFTKYENKIDEILKNIEK
jgi:hypothetical protein